jgi:predicted DNA-binding protein
MDLKKWKSVLVPRDVYEKLKIISKVEGRTISGQLRIIFENWINNNLSDADLAYVNQEILRNKPETVKTEASLSD